MAIQNGKQRVEGLRNAMHKEIDRLVDYVILKQSVKGFAITFDCGCDRLLTMNLKTDTVIKNDEGNAVFYTEKDIEPSDNMNDSDGTD